MNDLARKRKVEQTFSAVSDTFDMVGPGIFSYFGQRLVDHAGIAANSQVLDVACGSGSVLIPAARATLPDGKAVGIDISPGMAAVSNDRLREAGLTNGHAVVSDAESLDYPPASFEAILCGFAVHYFERPIEVLSDLRQLIKERGCFAATEWHREGDFYQLLDEKIAQYIPRGKLRLPAAEGQAERDLLKSADGIVDMLEQAGFTEVEVRQECKIFHFRDADEWFSRLWTGGLRLSLEALEEDAWQAFRQSIEPELAARSSDQGIGLPYEVYYLTGTRMD